MNMRWDEKDEKERIARWERKNKGISDWMKNLDNSLEAWKQMMYSLIYSVSLCLCDKFGEYTLGHHPHG